jgi:hypothetical protein
VHVTQVLGAFPPWNRFVELETTGTAAMREAIAAKRELGLAVHAATHYHDDGDLDMGTVDPVVLRYLQGWIGFKWQLKFEPEARELNIEHPILGYVGRLDAVGRVAGVRSIVDIKCTAQPPATAGPQLAAYLEAYRSRHQQDEWMDRWCVQLKPDGTFRMHKHTDRDDWTDFKAALQLYRRYQLKG